MKPVKKPQYPHKSVSFPVPGLMEAATARAKELRRSLSNYICGLVEDDLKASGHWPPERKASGRLVKVPLDVFGTLNDPASFASGLGKSAVEPLISYSEQRAGGSKSPSEKAHPKARAVHLPATPPDEP